MGRPREFDRDEALLTALHVFWAQGYEATTMTDLQKALGIGRQSLYATFGDKGDVFIEALSLYIASSEERIASRFRQGGGADAIRSHFEEAIERVTLPTPRLGCLLVNTAIELGPRSGPAGRLVTASLDVLAKGFERALHEASSAGHLRDHVCPAEAAASLIALNTGLLVMARNGASADALRQAVASSLAGLFC
ncbi:MAG: TetR/AcrR family transcriptional regulator [Myxococcota bacterium]